MNKEEIEKEAEEKFKVNNEDKDREHYYDRMWFKTGYLAGSEPREKRIEELERKLEQTEKDLADYQFNYPTIKELEKENAELKNKLTEKVTLESLDVVSAKMNDLEKENSELKRNKKTVVHLADCLEEKMKERVEELETRCNELFLQNNEFAEHLTKAKEIIKILLQYDRGQFFDNRIIYEKYMRTRGDAEQFLKEIER